MAESPIDNNDLITSFSNPNYQLNDELNANVTSDSTQYYDQGTIYNDENDFNDQQTGPTKQRRKYAHIDLTSMGIELHNGGEKKINSDNASLSSPDSLITSPSSDGRSEDSILYSDIKTPTSTTDNVIEVEHNDSEDDSDAQSNSGESNQPKGFMGYYASLELSAKARQKSREEEEEEVEGKNEENKKVASVDDENKTEKDNKQSYEGKTKDINSPDSNDSGIQADEGGGGGHGVQHMQGPVTGELYAMVGKKQKQVPQSSPSDEGNESSSPQGDENDEEDESGDKLPPGWEKHEDEQGPYYWHIKTGTIQRDAPPPAQPGDFKETKRSVSTNSDISLSSSGISSPSVPSTPSSLASSSVDQDHHLQEFEGHAFKYAAESLKSLRKPTPEVEPVPEASEKPIRFAVRSLGWVRIAEEDLTPERSSKAVNKCIVDLSLGRNDINDVVGRWGDGKDLYMDLDSQHLSLIDPQDVSVLNRQPIQSIRVWGVGRDNGRERDFAYVARDRMTRKHMCHVFRCDTPARQIANTLRDICKKIMMERAQQSLATPSSSAEPQVATKVHRPTNLPDLQKAGETNGQKLTFQNFYKTTSFPTPMEEPKKVLRGHYLGTAMVPKPTGMDLLNTAMEKVYARVPPEKWTFVNVAVAPSTITITEHATEKLVAECRVRFLSFMGIAQRNVKLCSFIMHGASEQYIAHVFHCEPSAGALCKTIEAACKLRYQKCLDAHPTTPDPKKQQLGQNGKGIKASLKQGMVCVLENMKSKKVKS